MRPRSRDPTIFGSKVGYPSDSLASCLSFRQYHAECRPCRYPVAVVATTSVEGACSGGWQVNDGYEYCADADEVTHATAQSTCHSRNSELTSITSSDECDYVNGIRLVDCDTLSRTRFDSLSRYTRFSFHANSQMSS